MLPDDANPYAAPKTSVTVPVNIDAATQPEVVRYYRAACKVLGSLYVSCSFVLVYFCFKDLVSGEVDGPLWWLALAFLILGGLYIGGLFLPRTPWTWWYGFCLLLLNGVTLPLIVFWLGSRTRHYYRWSSGPLRRAKS